MEGEKKIVRVWVDGCFDMMHYGHSNALRKAKALGDYLVVGVHSDEDISKNKGPPVTTEKERYAIVRACRWVDEVVEAAPYHTTLETLEKYNCDFCVHGDDIVTDSNGVDTYAQVKEAGKFKIIPRTEGVSTTDLVGRMLLAISTKDVIDEEEKGNIGNKFFETMSEGAHPLKDPRTLITKMGKTGLPEVFIEGRRPKSTERVGYINGTWDLFHYGHVAFLEKAKQQCDYLIVGVFPSHVVKEKKGIEWPIMSLKERGLTTLACKYVDEVVLGVPWQITAEFIQHLDAINDIRLTIFVGKSTDPAYHIDDDNDGLDVARGEDMLSILNSGDSVHATTIIQRIMKNRALYLERQEEKAKKAKAGFS
jgi:ethanolamine-phosphate cytidylyltransferase